MSCCVGGEFGSMKSLLGLLLRVRVVLLLSEGLSLCGFWTVGDMV